MENVQMTPNGFIKTISMLHFALVAGLLAFGLVIYFQGPDWNMNLYEDGDIFFFLIPLLALIGTILGNFIFRKKLRTLANIQELRSKIAGYQTASLIKFALIEGPALLSLVMAMQTSNMYYMGMAALLTLYLYSQKPSRGKIERDLELSGKLKARFQKGDQPFE